jgi:hypothetical protein
MRRKTVRNKDTYEKERLKNDLNIDKVILARLRMDQ